MTTDAVGQGRAVGNTLIGMGSVAVASALIAVAARLELRFIDGPAMAGFGVLMVATGLLQRWLVRAPGSSRSGRGAQQ